MEQVTVKELSMACLAWCKKHPYFSTAMFGVHMALVGVSTQIGGWVTYTIGMGILIALGSALAHDFCKN